MPSLSPGELLRPNFTVKMLESNLFNFVIQEKTFSVLDLFLNSIIKVPLYTKMLDIGKEKENCLVNFSSTLFWKVVLSN